MLHEIGDRVGWRWVNLWRDTDSIGGWIFSAQRAIAPVTVGDPSAAVDRRAAIPPSVVPQPGDSVRHRSRGTGPPGSDQRYAEAVRELAQRLRHAPRE